MRRLWLLLLLFGLAAAAHAQNKASWTPNPAGLRLATSAYLEEISEALYGRSSPLSFREAMLMARIGAAASARQYAADFEAGEQVVNDKYRGRRVLLSGVIRKHHQDASGKLSLSLAAQSGAAEVVARLEEDEALDMGRFKPGQRVSLVCQSGLKTGMRTTAQQCVLLSRHLEALRPRFSADIEAFVAGRKAWPKKTGEGVAFFYALGSSLKPGAPCLQFPSTQCPDLEAALRNDPVLAADLRRRLTELQAGLRFSPP